MNDTKKPTVDIFLGFPVEIFSLSMQDQGNSIAQSPLQTGISLENDIPNK